MKTSEPARATHPDLAFWRLLALVQTALFASIVVFMARPDLDIAAAALFAQPDGTFPLAHDPLAIGLRDVFRVAFWLAAACVLVLLGASLLRGAAARIPWKIWAFAASALALGPGLLVNAVLKSHVGRPRPFDVTAFGGEHAFVLPFALSDACARNCSFVSGEGAAMATLFLLVLVLGWHRGASRAGRAAIIALAPLALLAGGLRVAMGRHFLSDVVFAWFFCALVVMALYAVFRIGPLRRRVTAANVAADLSGAVATLRRGRRDPAPSEG